MEDSEIWSRNDPLVTKIVSKAKVAILGVGGLGSNIAMMLTRLGIAKLVLVDFDIVEASNLNRQFFNQTHIGELKTKALKSELLKINQNILIDTLNLKMTKDNIGEILKDESLICFR